MKSKIEIRFPIEKNPKDFNKIDSKKIIIDPVDQKNINFIFLKLIENPTKKGIIKNKTKERDDFITSNII
jgi:hypothetical protein